MDAGRARDPLKAKLEEASVILGEEVCISKEVLGQYTERELTNKVELSFPDVPAVIFLQPEQIEDKEVDGVVREIKKGMWMYACPMCQEVLLVPQLADHICSTIERGGKEASVREGERHREEKASVASSPLDMQCSVTERDTELPCTRSLNCKVHSILLKRAVKGRSVAFDVLLKKNSEERRKRKMERLQEMELVGKGAKKRRREGDVVEKAERDACRALEDELAKIIAHHTPVIEKTFCLPEIKFDTLAVRSVFFQPLKMQRTAACVEKKPPRRAAEDRSDRESSGT
jgi:SCA7, zinc-binding domain